MHSVTETAKNVQFPIFRNFNFYLTGEIATSSFIYKFSFEHRRLLLHQQIRTHAAVDVQYFRINEENFLVFANSFEKADTGEKNFETQSVIYKLSNDYFIPFQNILLYNVTQFLPVMVR